MIRKVKKEEMSKPKIKKLAVYTIIENGEGRNFWRLIGDAFTNRDESITVLLDALPINGWLHIREAMEKVDG